VLLAAVGWLMLPGPAWLWTLLTIAAPGAYLFTDLVTSLARGRRRGTVRGRLRGQLDHAGRWALAMTFMLYEATVAVDAIGRSLWRMYVSRRQLLEWTTAAQVEQTGDRRPCLLARHAGCARVGPAARDPASRGPSRPRWPGPRRSLSSGSSLPA
jgi:hypothetical protein